MKKGIMILSIFLVLSMIISGCSKNMDDKTIENNAKENINTEVNENKVIISSDNISTDNIVVSDDINPEELDSIDNDLDMFENY